MTADRKTLLMTILVLVIAAMFVNGAMNRQPSNQPPAFGPQAVDEEFAQRQAAAAIADQQQRLGLQAERKSTIEEAIRLGVFSRVVRNGDSDPRAWTGPTFSQIDFAAKQNALSVVYAYYFGVDDRTGSVAIMDNMNGREVGRFDGNGLRFH